LAQLEAALRQQRSALGDGLRQHLGGESRAEHAREVLLQDGDDAPQRDADREVDFARSDRDTVLLAQTDAALQRLADGDYGLCADCGEAIPVARLLLAPHAPRCVACENVKERGQPRPATL
jgi:DnaK suppressor protein